MALRRFLLQASPQGQEASLQGEEVHHLVHVLRAQIGDCIELIDGTGRVWSGDIKQIDRDRVEVTRVRLISASQATPTRLLLIQSLCKAEKLEWVLQKFTELGISEIHLLDAEHSVVKVPRERIEKRLERWTRIVIGAVKQSRRSNTPVLHAPVQCQTVCDHLQADLKLLFSERDSARHLKTILRECGKPPVVAFAIGPEGGWTPHEEAVFIQHLFQPASLGPSILRTETAAIVALAVLKYELEDHEDRAPVPPSG